MPLPFLPTPHPLLLATISMFSAEQTGGYQREGVLGDWVNEVKELKSTNW